MPASDNQHVLAFYSHHPISRDQILAGAQARRGHLDGLVPEDLFAFDQDHYGGLAVAYRVLKHGGRLAFTDWAEHRRLDETDSESMWRGIAAQSVQSFVGYPQMLREIGFRHVAADSRPRNESVTPVPRMKNSSRPATYNSTQ